LEKGHGYVWAVLKGAPVNYKDLHQLRRRVGDGGGLKLIIFRNKHKEI
jgi:hypothetical protein